MKNTDLGFNYRFFVELKNDPLGIIFCTSSWFYEVITRIATVYTLPLAPVRRKKNPWCASLRLASPPVMQPLPLNDFPLLGFYAPPHPRR